MNKKDTAGKSRVIARDILYEKIERNELEIPEAIKLIRKILNLSQVEFAKKIGVSKFSITNLERGVGNPTIKNIQRMLAPMKLDLKIGLKNKPR